MVDGKLAALRAVPGLEGLPGGGGVGAGDAAQLGIDAQDRGGVGQAGLKGGVGLAGAAELKVLADHDRPTQQTAEGEDVDDDLSRRVAAVVILDHIREGQRLQGLGKS